MQYSRSIGASFTIKTPEEKQEVMKLISENSDVSKFYKCIGINLERFTGRIQKIVLAQKDNTQQIISYDVSGEYPTMRLGSEHSSCSSFVIDFPVIKQVTVEVIKKEEPVKVEIKDEVKVEDKVKPEEPKPIVEEKVDKPVELDLEDAPFLQNPISEESTSQESQEIEVKEEPIEETTQQSKDEHVPDEVDALLAGLSERNRDQETEEVEEENTSESDEEITTKSRRKRRKN